MTRWRLLDTGAHDGAWNMACDVALMDRARRTGESMLRVYRWSQPTLSFGRHESAARQFDPIAIRAAGVETVRRPTGGRALLHDHEVTYSITALLTAGESLTASVRGFNRLLLDALRRLDVPAIEAESPHAMRPEGAACFAVPAAGELTLHGRKLVGSAQVRQDGALLQHGSILLDDDQGRIAAFATVPLLPSAPAASLHEAVGRDVDYSAVRDALFDAVRDAGVAAPIDESEALAESSDFGTALAQFRDAAWTWRR